MAKEKQIELEHDQLPVQADWPIGMEYDLVLRVRLTGKTESSNKYDIVSAAGRRTEVPTAEQNAAGSFQQDVNVTPSAPVLPPEDIEA